MRRSICVCEPSVVRAGQQGTWKFHYTTAIALEKGAVLKFDLHSAGRDMDWQEPVTSLRAKGNVLYGLLPGRGPIGAKAVPAPEGVVPHYELTLPTKLGAGETITFVVGALPDQDPVQCGNKAQENAQRRRAFSICVDPKGKGQYESPDTFCLDVRGGVLQTIQIAAPSIVARNKRFDVVARFEDEYGNLTSMAPEGTLIELTYQNIRENLSWKLFVPETGYLSLPNLYFNELGLYHLQFKNLLTDEVFVSSPIRCVAEAPVLLYWGLLHGESDRVDSQHNMEACLRHFRDERSLSFYASSPFSTEEELSAEEWRSLSNAVEDFNEDERFATLLGMQWVGESPAEGSRHLMYSKGNKPLLRRSEMKSSSLGKIYRTHMTKELLSIPQFTMGSESSYDFSSWSPEFETVVEIFNAWGSSESGSKEELENLCPITPGSRKGVKGVAEGSIQKALLAGCRFGFVAGGLDDRGIYSALFDQDQVQYTPGLTAILAPSQTREALFEALKRRSCYATTGARMLVHLEIAGKLMGQEVDTKDKPGLYYNRHFVCFTAGTAPLEKIEMIRNGVVAHVWEPSEGQDHMECTWDDLEDFRSFCVWKEGDKGSFAYYYLRVTQSDGHVAWSSPIWIDFHPHEDFPKASKKRR